jgi:hypothetical protein
VQIAAKMCDPQEPSLVLLTLRREDRGAVLAYEPVTHGDLSDAMAELWFESCLRKGFGGVALSEVRAELRPVYPNPAEGGETGRRCLGFDLETRDPKGQLSKCFFPLRSLSWVAARAARKLVSAGELKAEDTYYYELNFESAPEVGADEQAEAEWTRAEAEWTRAEAEWTRAEAERTRAETKWTRADPEVSTHTIAPAASGPPPVTLAVPLKPLLERARSAVDLDGEHFPTFYTPEAREKAERIAREGGSSNPPIETGGLLVGPLCTCPDTGELFAVIVDVLEAANTEGTTYSLTYSGATWAQIQTVMRAKQAHPSTRGHRILGQVHGHSFLPLGGLEPCEACHLVEICTRSSAYLSLEDRDWCRAVFSRQPWQLSHIFGFDARSERVETFYGQMSGSLVTRGYAVLDSNFEGALAEGVLTQGEPA